VLAILAPDVQKDASISGVFNEVQPIDGKWFLEVGIELPDLLPAIDGKSEAILTVQGMNGQSRELCLSNRISRFHFEQDGEPWHVLVPRTAPSHGSAEVIPDKKSAARLHAIEEQLRTMAALRLPVEGETAELAFEGSARQCVEELLHCVNKTLQALRQCGAPYSPAFRAVRWDGLGRVYVLMCGKNEPGGGQLAPNAKRVGLNPAVLEGERGILLRDIASGATELDDLDRLLSGARSSLHDGDYEFAFLESVIAAEIATQRCIHRACGDCGVSNKKLKNHNREMTYSWALNVGLPMALHRKCRPSSNLIGCMDRARTKRNDLMHQGEFDMTGDELSELLGKTEEFIRFLKQPGTPTS